MQTKLFDGVFGTRGLKIELLEELKGFSWGTNTDFKFAVFVDVFIGIKLGKLVPSQCSNETSAIEKVKTIVRFGVTNWEL